MRRCLLLQARHAVEADVDVIQVRERDLAAPALLALVRDVVDVARGSRTRVLVNDRLDVALAAGAAGVHLRRDSIPPDRVRTIAPAGFIVGLSVHSLEEATAAAADVDYLIAGTIWATPSKPSGWSVAGPGLLGRIAASARVPVLAIGGVTLERMPEIAASGAAGAAAIGLFMGPLQPGSANAVPPCRAGCLRDIVRSARDLFDTSRQERVDRK